MANDPPRAALPQADTEFIVLSFLGHIRRIGTHCYGCRVLQKVIEFGKPEAVAKIYDEICSVGVADGLVKDQYGRNKVRFSIVFVERGSTSRPSPGREEEWFVVSVCLGL